jgi:hypothetical protein
MNKYKNLSSSALVKTGYGEIVGIIVNSHSSGTLKLWDALTATTPILCNTITLVAGERWIPFFNATFDTGLYLTIGGTADVTVVYK